MWTREFEPPSGVLDDAARLKLVHALEKVGAPWCVARLEEAMNEDRLAAVRDEAERALGRMRRATSVDEI